MCSLCFALSSCSAWQLLPAVARVALAAGDVHGTKNQKWPVVVMTSTLHKEESPVCDVRES